jgi:hypothetical protein
MLRAERPGVQEPRWENVDEPWDDSEAFKRRIVEHVLAGGICCIEGSAGTGKMEVLKAVADAFGSDCKKICLTRCGARNCGAGASTAHHFVMKHMLNGSSGGKVVLIDEISFMPQVLLAALEHLRLKKVCLICFGDLLQLPLVSDSWRG